MVDQCACVWLSICVQSFAWGYAWFHYLMSLRSRYCCCVKLSFSIPCLNYWFIYPKHAKWCDPGYWNSEYLYRSSAVPCSQTKAFANAYLISNRIVYIIHQLRANDLMWCRYALRISSNASSPLMRPKLYILIYFSGSGTIWSECWLYISRQRVSCVCRFINWTSL